MGCDIHACVERLERLSNGEPFGWKNAGDPDLHRNYEMFAVLAGVRNYDEIVPVAEPKGMPGYEGYKAKHDYHNWSWSDSPDSAYQAYYERWLDDAHTPSWLTLAEIKAYDTTQEVNDGRLIIGRSDDGGVSAVCRATTGTHEGHVGKRRIFTWPGEDDGKPTAWDRLIAYMENVRAFHDLKDDEVRLVFFFDN